MARERWMEGKEKEEKEAEGKERRMEEKNGEVKTAMADKRWLQGEK